MVDPRDILKFSDEIARRFKPEKIILFGSYAYGTPTEDSDVDLMVIMPHRGAAYLKASEIAIAVGHWFPNDLMVRSPAVFNQRLRWKDWFIVEIAEKGICLYDASSERLGRGGRRRFLRRFPPASRPQRSSVRQRPFSFSTMRRKVLESGPARPKRQISAHT
jgi:predicted nucleotidyltransferase